MKETCIKKIEKEETYTQSCKINFQRLEVVVFLILTSSICSISSSVIVYLYTHITDLFVLQFVYICLNFIYYKMNLFHTDRHWIYYIKIMRWSSTNFKICCQSYSSWAKKVAMRKPCTYCALNWKQNMLTKWKNCGHISRRNVLTLKRSKYIFLFLLYP